MTNLEPLAKKLNMPKSLIEKVYKAYWKYIKTTIEAMPLKEDITDKLFYKLRASINLPNLGKLYCTLDNYKRVRTKFLEEDVKDKKDKSLI